MVEEQDRRLAPNRQRERSAQMPLSFIAAGIPAEVRTSVFDKPVGCLTFGGVVPSIRRRGLSVVKSTPPSTVRRTAPGSEVVASSITTSSGELLKDVALEAYSTCHHSLQTTPSTSRTCYMNRSVTSAHSERRDNATHTQCGMVITEQNRQPYGLLFLTCPNGCNSQALQEKL